MSTMIDVIDMRAETVETVSSLTQALRRAADLVEPTDKVIIEQWPINADTTLGFLLLQPTTRDC